MTIKGFLILSLLCISCRAFGADNELAKTLDLLRREAWGDNQIAAWQDQISSLRRQARQIVPEIAKALDKTPVEKSAEEVELVFLLGEIASPQAIPILKNFIAEPIPAGLEGDDDRILMAKTMAVEALLSIAKQSGEPKGVIGPLMKGLRSPHRSVRRAATVALKALYPGDLQMKNRILVALPDDEHYFYDLRIQQEPLILRARQSKDPRSGR